jgi:hypothetical protein
MIPSLKMNKLSSSKTQLPYEYYSLPYCRPDNIVSSAENLGEVLRGDRIVNSRYQVRVKFRLLANALDHGQSNFLWASCRVQMSMRHDEQCKLLCPPVKLDAAKAKAFRTRVEEEYRVNMCAFIACCNMLAQAVLLGAPSEWRQVRRIQRCPEYHAWRVHCVQWVK